MRIQHLLLTAIVANHRVNAESTLGPDGGVSNVLLDIGSLLLPQDIPIDEGDLNIPDDDEFHLMFPPEDPIYGVLHDPDKRLLGVDALRHEADKASRRLSANSASIGAFSPLACNVNLASQGCTKKVSDIMPTAGNPLLVPCGECYIFDLAGTEVSFDGINIIGKLKFPNNKKVTVRTKYVIVQGELEITADHATIAPENESVVFIITGTADVKWKATNNPNTGACDEQPSKLCNLGAKPFFVAGGKLNIEAFPPGGNCKTHTPILDKVLKKPDKDPNDFPKFEELLQSCPVSGVDLVRYTFDDDSVGNWTGHWGAFVEIDDGALKVTNRQRSDQGPEIDLSVLTPQLCLVPEKEYLFSVEIKLDKADGTDANNPTPCKIDSNKCPRLTSRIGKAEGGDIYSERIRMAKNDSPNYGEWGDFTGIIKFSEEELFQNVTYFVLQIDRVEAGVDITIDNFRIALPTDTSFPDPNDVCSELVFNGDAEGNGIVPYPMGKIHGSSTVLVSEEAGNMFFRLTNRSDRDSFLQALLDIKCLDRGVIYMTSMKVRIHSEFDESYSISVRAKRPDGSWFYRNILECPGQKYDDGWVTCSGEFMIDEDIAEATEIYWRGAFQTNNVFDVDYDDISIKYHQGYVRKLVVSTEDVLCWGVDSEVHVGSSVYYSFSSVRSNGFDSGIRNMLVTSDATTEITLKDVPTVPVITAAEDDDFKTNVALVSRNVKIAGDEGEDKKGAYLQVLHTANVPQLISGVEFLNMGRNGEVDRFGLQILYSGSIEGTLITKNSFYKSNQRCIVVEGSSGMTVSHNVGVSNYGNCIWFGSQSQDNTIRKNFVSDSRGMESSEMIPGENDHYPAGFCNRNGQNDYARNIAVGNRAYGFYFYNDWQTILEDGSREYPSPRTVPMGEFTRNEAASNGHIGMHFAYHEQIEEIVFDELKSLKNRYHGFFLYYSQRVSIRNSLFAENGYGLEMRWSDKVEVVDTEIRGVSEVTKTLSRPPYFSKPCISSGFLSPIGYRMQTVIYRWDQQLADQSYPENKGATLTNVRFSLFDHDDECSDSVPIAFDTDDKRDGHWNYASTFNNVDFDGAKIMDAKAAATAGVSDIVIIDSNGSSDPAGKASAASAFVSNKPYLTGFVRGVCTAYSDGIAYCENACLRTVTLSVDQTDSFNYDLKITRFDDGKEVFGQSIYQFDDDPHLSTYEANERRFSMSLPSGTYKFEFFDNDVPIWPKHVYEIWEALPDCDGHANGADIAIVEPEMEDSVAECENLIINGDMENTKHWQHKNSRSDTAYGYLKALPGKGIGGSMAIGYFNRTRGSDGISQNIDTRCLHLNQDEFYEINVWYRLEIGGVPHSCDRFDDTWAVRCPEVTIKTFGYDDPASKETPTSAYARKGKVVMPNGSDQFNLIHGVVKIDKAMQMAQRAWLYTDNLIETFDYILDDFSFTKMEHVCTGELVRNGNFELGYSSFWTLYGTAKYNIVNFPLPSDHAIEVYDKSENRHGIVQDLYIDQSCIQDKDRYRVVAKFRMKDGQGNDIACDRKKNDGETTLCGKMGIQTWSEHGNRYVDYQTVAIAPGEYEGWSLMAGIFTMSASEANHTSMQVRLHNTHTDNTVIYDDVSMTRIPRNCEQMVVNPSFEGGTTSFWMPTSLLSDYTVTAIGEGSSEYSVFFQHSTDDVGSYLYQELDTRCFVEGQQFDISVNFKLLNGADPTKTETCSNAPEHNSNGDPEQCPSVYLYGYNCADGNVQATLWSENQASWSSSSFNEFQNDFKITANLATCDNVRIGLGRYLPLGLVLLFDDVQVGQKTTFAPTKSPTQEPTKEVTTGPTPSPTTRTDAPTTSNFKTCPSVGSAPEVLDGGSVMVGTAAKDTLCTIKKVTLDGNTVQKSIPLARSYDLNAWEKSAGEFSTSTFTHEFLCYSQGCQINLPQLEAGEKYHLASYAYALNERNEFARFLETATYGVTRAELDAFTATSQNVGSLSTIVNWIQSQMDPAIVPMTSHREFWRKRVNPRAPASTVIGIPDHPCDQYSRWRKFSFVRNDAVWFMPKQLRVTGGGPYTLYLDGVMRTKTDILWIGKNDTYEFDPTFDYVLCNSNIQERVGGKLYIQLEDGKCIEAANPEVDVTGLAAANIVNLLPSDLDRADVDFTGGEEFMLRIALDDANCNNIPTVPELGDEPVFGKLPDGSWLQFDPRLNLATNDLTSPLSDGGKAATLASGGGTSCSNVPRTFLNEKHCTVGINACKSTTTSNELEVFLDNATISELHYLSGRYLYALKGLNVIDQTDTSAFPWKLDHPCNAGYRSRWMQKDSDECVPTSLYSDTNKTLAELLSSSGDRNQYIRDIFFPEEGASCNETDYETDIEIVVDDQCWKRVHDDYLSIYDMTYWVDRHPGGPDKIMKWAKDNGTVLVFPNDDRSKGHTMDRWHNNYHKFPFIGRFGDYMRIRDLPNEVRTENVTSFYDNASNENSNGVLVCGSPDEVSNDRTLEFVFDVNNGFSTGYYDPARNKDNVWIMASLEANDQLRQRAAWALSQILVVVTVAIGDASSKSEWFVAYYDIFVRNAFGNYRDVLKEISYSPLMAENLSFLQSRSSAYVWERYRIKAQADENFAREIMQLFSMGIIKLNMDGSPMLDAQGKTELAYTNEDIMSLSRAWTGFDLQPMRGNMEGSSNRLDPMRLEASWRDRFPKSDSAGGYIGDRYPLCADLPKRAFLREGAVYRFLGSSPLPELMSDPSEFASDDSIVRVVLGQSSKLREELCNVKPNGSCRFKNTVVLDSSVDCDGVECEIEALRVVQVADDAFYEYVRLPCVNQVFYNGGVKISTRYAWDPVMCANPKLPDASEACCDFLSSFRATRNSKYDGERMVLATATDRCEQDSKEVCDFNRIDGDRHKNSMYFWTSDDCYVRVKVSPDGMITVVHHPTDSTNIVSHLDEENENWFRVYWNKDEYPKARNDCDGACEVIAGDSCLCSTQVTNRQVFSAAPRSITEALEKLTIGALDPNIFAPNSFTSSHDPNTGITTYLKNGNFNTNAVFELTDDKGRHYFLKNSEEAVQVRSITRSGGLNTGYSFRNAPQFMSFVPSETTTRDAQYETEATLDHYFYHDNTAPFLALRLIQRLVSSNPSPRYILTVATAFKDGQYQQFGNGVYGDLSATFAAIYLDREARSVVLDADPSQGSLREPILKVMALLRSMEFNSTYPVTRLVSLKEDIGQMAHNFESVFSFFLPEFKPFGRVGEATLVAPEGTLLDMPRIVGLLNGLQSLVKYGLSSCEGGFGWDGCRERAYQPSPLGVLEYERSDPNAEFSYETFEGPSLIGGLDNTWVGRQYTQFYGEMVDDPLLMPNNHVYHAAYNGNGYFFSPPASRSGNTVVKFQYYSAQANAGGCIGYTDDDTLISQQWIYCDFASSSSQQVMTAGGSWISCQFEIPADVNQFRVVVGDRKSTGDAYFDNIHVTAGTGTTCTAVTIASVDPPGQVGHSHLVVDELATLLTAGRLSSDHRDLIRLAYDSSGSANDGLRMAQQLILTTAEFHTTNGVRSENGVRTDVTFPEATNKPYRAVVYVMFSGGCDSFNLLMPHTCTKGKDLYEEYLDVRQQVAIPKQDLLPVSADNQVCETFGIHPDLEEVQRLYNAQDLLFFANTGVLSRPVDKTNYYHLTETQLFAHNHMQRESKRLDPYDTSSGTGVLGRISDILSSNGQNIGSFSVDRYSVALVGSPGMTAAPMIVNRNGVPEVYMDDTQDFMTDLHRATSHDSGIFAETWSASMMESLGINHLLSSKLQDVSTHTVFPNAYFASQLQTVARLIATREARGVDTDTFYVEIGGFDTHSNVEENLSNRFVEVNEGIQAFAAELKHMGLWNNVTTIQASDFARTLNPNSGDGTDHAWGGNYMMFGGSVKGGKILGDYPDNLTDAGPLTLNRGRMIPSTPWDAVFRGIASWLGVPNSKMNEACPNLSNFDTSHFFDVDDMFGAVPPPAPTIPPTPSPTTGAPTSNPTNAPQPTPSPTGKTSAPTKATDSPTSKPTVGEATPTESPTAYPTFGSTCFDDASYLFEGESLKSCASWVGKNENKVEARCRKKDTTNDLFVFEFCRKTCGTCKCQNDDWHFRNEPSKNCEWVGKNIDARCGKTGASENCPEACGLPCCKDNPAYRSGGNDKRSCTWMSQNPTERCIKSWLDPINCPQTCGRCIFG